jgi:hypothetical protein
MATNNVNMQSLLERIREAQAEDMAAMRRLEAFEAANRGPSSAPIQAPNVSTGTNLPGLNRSAAAAWLAAMSNDEPSTSGQPSAASNQDSTRPTTEVRPPFNRHSH